MTKSSYTVEGMTCGHCVSSVTEEVGEIDGVTNVDVELATGKVTVVSEAQVPLERVRDAVTESGYRLVG